MLILHFSLYYKKEGNIFNEKIDFIIKIDFLTLACVSVSYFYRIIIIKIREKQLLPRSIII